MGPSLLDLERLVVTANLLLGIAAVLWLVSYGVSQGLDRIADWDAKRISKSVNKQESR